MYGDAFLLDLAHQYGGFGVTLRLPYGCSLDSVRTRVGLGPTRSGDRV
jgi:hypothetical protein